MTTSTSNKKQFRRGALVALAVVAVVALVPIMVFAAWTVRAVALVALPVVALAVVFSPALRRWFGFSEDAEATYKGMRLPADRALHADHVWLQPQAIGRVTLGVDDLAQMALGPVETVTAAPVGTHVARGDSLFEVRHGGRTIDVKAPVSGTIAARNARLSKAPGLVNDDPYGLGWVVEMKVDRGSRKHAATRRGEGARAWFAGEVDKLIGIVSPAGAHAGAFDGGAIASDLHTAIDDETWARVNSELFGA